MEENNLTTDKVVTVNTSGDLKKVDPKVFYNSIDQTINFSSTADDLEKIATGNEDVIWFGGSSGKLKLLKPTDEQIKRGRVIHIIAAGGPVEFTGYKPVVKNGTTITTLAVGNRISVIPVDVFGGKAWYCVSSSQTF